MKDKYIKLKLNKKEVEVLKNALARVIMEDLIEKNKPDYEDKIKEDYETYSKLHRHSTYCKKILDIITYLER